MNDYLPANSNFNRLDVAIRPMRSSDLPVVIELDAQVYRKPRPMYFERRLSALEHSETGDHLIFLVADYQGDTIGFIMGSLTSGEFGLADVTAIIDSIAVHPRHQRQHIGQQLIESFLSRGASLGAKAASTLVPWENWELLKVFHALGFSMASTVPLERQIG